MICGKIGLSKGRHGGEEGECGCQKSAAANYVHQSLLTQNLPDGAGPH